MKIKARSFSFIMALVLLSITIPFYADEDNIESSRLTVEEIVENQQIRDEIDTYLKLKLNTSLSVATAQESELTEVEQNAITRSLAFQSFEENLNVEFAEVEIDSTIEEVLAQDENELKLKVYEWTEIEYYASPDVEVTDIMGYGTHHEMTFEVENDEYTLVNDSYDERIMTGACSADILAEEESIFAEYVVVEKNAIDLQALSGSRAAYSVNSVINYAHTYCGVASASQDYSDDSGVQGSINTALYNQNYPYYEGFDCANYVSQCLSAGGLSTDSTWYSGAYAWINARELANYLIARGYSSYAVTSSNIYPGNPVYWTNSSGSSSSGHQMICTGYNSAGVPVLNAHNIDTFRVPYTHFASSHSLKTIQIVSSDQHTHVAEGSIKYNASSHYYLCKHCRKTYNKAAHTIITTGVKSYCSVCKYTGPFASVSSYENEPMVQ